MGKMQGFLAVAMLSVLASVAQEAAPAVAEGAPAGGQVAQPVEVQSAEACTNQGKTKEEMKKELSRMRGKLLYKKGQVRKLEKAALAADAALAAKTGELERQRRELYVAAEPKLAALYEEQDALELQVKTASENSKL